MNTETKALERYNNFNEFLSGVYSDESEYTKAAFRSGLYKPNRYQIAWKDWLMKKTSTILITIKLPEYRSLGNYYKALELYKNIIREFEQEFTNSKNHWVNKPLPFKGSFQKTKSGTWMFYLLIETETLNKNMIYKLCLSAQIVIEKHKLNDEVIDIRPIDKQDGISMFVVKTQTYHEDLSHNEGNTIYGLKTLFNVEEKPDKIQAYIQKLGNKPLLVPGL